MGSWWPLIVLVGVVTLILVASRRPALQPLFRWLPIPLWCYGLPMVLGAAGALPTDHFSYRWITEWLLAIALGLLLLGVDLRALARVGSQALVAMVIGAMGIVLGGPIMLWAFQSQLPPEAWKGIGTLAATWTGGSLNMLALRTILKTPDSIFAPLVVVDALVAYSWMAFLIFCQGCSGSINRWLVASDLSVVLNSGQVNKFCEAKFIWNWRVAFGATALSVGLTLLCRGIAQPLPLGGLVASTTGWTILLVTTAALILACVPTVRKFGQHGSSVGYPCLYVVLASLGAQASLKALATTPIWILVGFSWVAFHATILLLAGRMLRLPLGVLATASQANVGGVVSAPLVGAVYSQGLAPIGLCLAIIGNAVGTYLGLLSASITRLFIAQP